MKNFEFIEHTADIRVKVYGKTLEDLFLNSAQALFKLLIGEKNFSSLQEKDKDLKIEEEDIESLLVRWINELISIFFAEYFLPLEFKLKIDTDSIQKLSAYLKGVDFNPYADKINVEVKAATYHGLVVKQTDSGFEAEVIFDV